MVVGGAAAVGLAVFVVAAVETVIAVGVEAEGGRGAGRQEWIVGVEEWSTTGEGRVECP